MDKRTLDKAVANLEESASMYLVSPKGTPRTYLGSAGA